jgi:hypothetical protein
MKENKELNNSYASAEEKGKKDFNNSYASAEARRE